MTVSYSIPNPTSHDWIGLSPAGASLQTYWIGNMPAAARKLPVRRRASGSCPFTAPSTAGTYEFRLFANNLFTLLDSRYRNRDDGRRRHHHHPPRGVGPQSTITCPAGAVDIVPGTSIPTIQSSIDVPGATTFCFRAGVHYLTSSITPKTGNTFVGEYGAILDGTGWTTTDDTAGGVPSSRTQDIDYVTIRNLVIRNMPGVASMHIYVRGRITGRSNTTRLASNYSGIVFPA